MFKQIWLVLLFYAAESLVTSFFLSLYSYFSKPNSSIDELFRYTLVFFGMRIIYLQAIVELIVIFIIIRYGGWEKLWLIMFGVFVSATIWGGVIGLGSRNDFGLLKAAFTGYGLPLFLGTLVSWWFCYKWLRLKT